MEKAETLKCFALVFKGKTCSQATVHISTSWRLEGQAAMGSKTVGSAWRNWMYSALRGWMKFSWVLKELAYVISQCVNSLFSLTNPVIGRGLKTTQNNCKKTCSKSLRSGKGKKWPRKPRWVSQLHFHSWKDMGYVFLESIYRYEMGKKVLRNSQHGLSPTTVWLCGEGESHVGNTLWLY